MTSERQPAPPAAAVPAAAPDAAPFSRRALLALLSVGIGTFLVGLLLAAFAGDLFGERSAGHDTYSRSLVGYRGLVAVLERAGVPVVVARSAAARRPSPSFPLLLLEPLARDGQEPFSLGRMLGPDDESEHGERLADVLSAAWDEGAQVVLVLPKWRAHASPKMPAWIEQMALQPPERVAELLAAALGQAEDGVAPAAIVRPGRPVTGFRAPASGLAEPAVALGADPQLLSPALAEALDLAPHVFCDEGILVAGRTPREEGGDLVIVSDPDLLNNRGLRTGDNARVVALLLDRLGAEGVVIDEVLHGHVSADSVLGRALRFPLVLVVVHGALALALLAWSVSTRFGRELPAPPALPPGKQLLIDNTAALLRSAGDHGDAVRRYLAIAKARVARRFSLPEGTSEEDLRDRLERLNEARRSIAGGRGAGLGAAAFDLGATEQAATNPRLSAHDARRLARRIHAWQRELLGGDGSPRAGGRQRPTQGPVVEEPREARATPMSGAGGGD